ncbi:hypothetical protein F3Y22_tig00004111pilonHSYRG00085 [Hibiscus syriacus]|uniref:Senescence regulator S40 n=1 Tax=Hibiscus syriacus TaxID=106335 RepID=A0A6A3CJ07_HIBSY|nr:uncharacterized protein LOC120191197 [Hibiscus syriacus]XP_039050105.1 uncharacterized protein LOC120191197 [Hibiscus syriacus]XP_039050112.1 uncharacterized protein LOC120191197 [Hibiscus syriacus]KAE8728687.1 hypothetical protein F3Y22_tig00004111pilonHSYRG00085 [Hibiscus syriacus]
MAKGRRLTTSRSELFLGSYGYGHGQTDTIAGDSELREEDVWSMADNDTDRDDQTDSNEIWNYETRGGRRRIPRGGGGDCHVGGLSLAFEDSSSMKSGIVHQYRTVHDNVTQEAEAPRGRLLATSAPLNVPDWSKIYRADSLESMHDSDDDGGESDMMPPHEYLAREYARRKKSGGASVCEGVGRTLKGRDMRRVRDAVWSQTGFYG